MTDLIARAEEWIAADPDPETRAELRSLIESGDHSALHSMMDGSLTFGTAGIRGKVGAGPNRMNRAVVIRTSSGLASYLLTDGAPTGPVVVGFDARADSLRFAEDAAGVLAAAGIPVLHFPAPTPTPLVAFAAKHLNAAAAVVITASHNPAADNGYKVYGANAAQIIPPADTEIASVIHKAPPASEVPRIESAFSGSNDLIGVVPADLLDCYWHEIDSCRPAPVPSNLRVVYTPLHGVGGDLLRRTLERGGHTGLIPVPEQLQPNGSFPTVPFPNPEEPGALDLAMALATEVGADLVLANDPDADRLAVVVPVVGEWRPLTGDEVGVLLGDFVLSHHTGDKTPIVVSTIVSSGMLARLAAIHGAHHELTLTGFKWIVNAGLALERDLGGRFLFGYEEALGYTVGSAVRDKDGISAALVICDLAAMLADQGQTLLDRLAELWGKAGVWASAQHSVALTGEGGQEAAYSAVDRLAASPPQAVGGREVTSISDYRKDAETRPAWLGAQELIELSLAGEGRVLVRPSGTEPKIKIYADLTTEPDGDVHRLHRRLLREARDTAGELADWLASALSGGC